MCVCVSVCVCVSDSWVLLDKLSLGAKPEANFFFPLSAMEAENMAGIMFHEFKLNYEAPATPTTYQKTSESDMWLFMHQIVVHLL